MISVQTKKLLAQSEELILSIVICVAVVVMTAFAFRVLHERISQKAQEQVQSLSLITEVQGVHK